MKDQEKASDADRLKEAEDRAARIDELERRIKADSAKLAEKKKELKSLTGGLVEDLLNPDQGRLPLEGPGSEDRGSLKDQAARLEGHAGKPAKGKAAKGQKAKVVKPLPTGKGLGDLPSAAAGK